MKIPNTFIPEHKSLEQKTEQLLEEAKIIKEQTQDDAKERLLNMLMSYLNTEPLSRPIELYNILGGTLENESYSSMALKTKQKGEYWTKKISASETKVFFKKHVTHRSPKKTEYGLAILKEKNLELFCKKMEKHTKEENNIRGYFLDNYNFLNFVIGGLTAAVAVNYLISQIPPDILDTTKNSIIFLTSLASVASVCIGGQCLDSYLHNRNKKKMIKLCSYYTEDEKEALRMMLE